MSYPLLLIFEQESIFNVAERAEESCETVFVYGFSGALSCPANLDSAVNLRDVGASGGGRG